MASMVYFSQNPHTFISHRISVELPSSEFKRPKPFCLVLGVHPPLLPAGCPTGRYQHPQGDTKWPLWGVTAWGGFPSYPLLPPSPTTSIQKLLLEVHRSPSSPQRGPEEQERPRPRPQAPPQGAAARPDRGRHRPHTAAASRLSPVQRRRLAPSGLVRSMAGSDWLRLPHFLIAAIRLA